MMCSKFAVLALFSVTCLVHGGDVKDKRQVGSAVVDTKEDHAGSETGFGHGHHHHHGAKYFQDIYMAQHKPEEIEFGHVCETPDDWEQRFEKINLKDRKHQGKVRWGDKHGGYGEHYWDYNHAGHGHDDHGEESQTNEEYAPLESKHAPKYSEQLRGKREPNARQDVEFINDEARAQFYTNRAPKHGGNYRAAPGLERAKREHSRLSNNLVYETDLGLIIDQATGKKYELKPIEA